MVKISVVTVCRNDINGLRETFESLRAQDCNEYEWRVLDGSSTDGTVEWLREHHTLDGGWISEPDNGIYDAMNKGIGAAAGEYLLLMHSGDLLAGPDVISKLIRLITRETAPPDFVFGDSLDVDRRGKAYYRRAISASRIKFGMITRHQSMLYRREMVERFQYPSNFRLSGDYALTAAVLMRDRVNVLKVDFPVCRFSLGGAHDTRRLKALREDFEIRHTILKVNYFICSVLFCVHWLHYYMRKVAPGLNRRFIYRGSQ